MRLAPEREIVDRVLGVERRILTLAVLAALAVGARTAGGEPRKKDLVLVGTVVSIAMGGDQLQPWIVTVTVNKVVSGEYAEERFSFPVHSPSAAGLEDGKSYTIRAVWKGGGYHVDETQWKKRTRRGPKE